MTLARFYDTEPLVITRVGRGAMFHDCIGNGCNQYGCPGGSSADATSPLGN